MRVVKESYEVCDWSGRRGVKSLWSEASSSSLRYVTLLMWCDPLQVQLQLPPMILRLREREGWERKRVRVLELVCYATLRFKKTFRIRNGGFKRFDIFREGPFHSGEDYETPFLYHIIFLILLLVIGDFNFKSKLIFKEDLIQNIYLVLNKE